MNMKFRFSVFIIPVLLVAAAAVFLKSPEEHLVIHTASGEFEVSIEIAQTAEEKRLGLMGRTSLPEDSGMIFVYEESSLPTMWMKNMLIPLDILFIGEDGIIHHVEEAVPPCEAESDDECPRYFSGKPSKWVLELPSGTATREGIEVGDRVSGSPL